MFFVLSRACNKEKLLSPYEELKIRPSELYTETLRWVRSITKSMTRVLHTARTRIVDSVTVDNFFFILHSWQDEKHLSLSLCILTWKFQIADLMKMLFFCLVIPTSLLSNNKLKSLPDGLFNSLSKLTHLWVK